MGQVSAYHEAPYQGVSQAAPQVRLPNQAEALEDMFVTIPQGAQPRPPITFLGVLEDHPGDVDGVFAMIPRGSEAEDAILTMTLESAAVVPRVYALTDLALSAVTIEAGVADYLDVAAILAEDLFVSTVVDYTFIGNRVVEVDNLSATQAARPPEGMVWVRASAYGRTYKVIVTPSGGAAVTVTLKTPSGATSASAEWVDTDTIAASLMSGSYTATDGGTISGNLNALTGSGFTLTRVGGVISFIRASGGDFTIKVEDGQGGTALLAVKDKVQRFSDLPQKALDGFTVRIGQTSGTVADDFFVRFDETAGTGTGSWEECLAPGAPLGIDPETMPVGLTKPAGTWTLDFLPWKGRTTGDAELVADPQFVGQAIEDLTWWRGRLALIAGEGVTLCASDDPFRSSLRTLSAVLDSDPIERVNPSPGNTRFHYGIPFENRLVLVGENLQAQVTSDGLVTPGRADIDALAGIVNTRFLRPQQAQNKLYFASRRGTSATAVFEGRVVVRENGETMEGEDLTSQVPRYVPASVNLVASCPGSYTTVYGTAGDTELYVHLYRWAEAERVQNAWMRWHLPSGFTLGGMFFRETKLYILLCIEGAAVVGVMDISPGLLDDHASARLLTYLDLRVKSEDLPAPTYDEASDITAFELPYAVDGEVTVAVRAPGGLGGPTLPGGLSQQQEGVLVEQSETDGDTVTLDGDWQAVPLWFGLTYSSEHTLSRIYAQDGNSRPMLSGRLQVRGLKLDLAETGYLRAEVTQTGRDTREYVFEGYRLDDPASLLDTSPLATTTFSVPVMGENVQTSITLVNDSHLRSALQGLEWRGEFNPKAGRL